MKFGIYFVNINSNLKASNSHEDLTYFLADPSSQRLPLCLCDCRFHAPAHVIPTFTQLKQGFEFDCACLPRWQPFLHSCLHHSPRKGTNSIYLGILREYCFGWKGEISSENFKSQPVMLGLYLFSLNPGRPLPTRPEHQILPDL